VAVTSFRFPKNNRLLNAADYKTVFDNARFKVSCQEILVLAVANTQPFPRLGLVIAKKNVAKAVQRNRLKRLLRNSFRLNNEQLSGLDIVVLIRKNADTLDNQQITDKIQQLWCDLKAKTEIKKRNKSATESLVLNKQ